MDGKIVTMSSNSEQQRADIERLERTADLLKTEKQDLQNMYHTASSDYRQQRAKVEGLERTVNGLETEKRELKDQINTMSSDNGKQRAEIECLRQTVSGLEKKDNYLPFQYHKSTVRIMNFGSQMALDAGAGEITPSAPEFLIMTTDSLQMATIKHMASNWI